MLFTKILYGTLACIFLVGVLGACNGGTAEDNMQDGAEQDEAKIETEPTDKGIEEDHFRGRIKRSR
ncbi:hypothetical protein [Salicibibacter kimchii]|uniref:Lipoprotein n=1 Tax=Salicibibacter kimchii TaxID=2099786 RepID=A0A345C2Q9_9BACI|nr:hypothetical protein [Salicibibacter kimchii]AXF57490.1 hypothetical protein DT065_16860 [Salicibibacter kimchii]